MSEEKVQILAELVHQHPYHADVVVQRKQKTARVTEYLSLREFHRTALYNEFYKYIGGDTQITTCLNVSPELFVACSLHRLKRDFTDRDCKLLNLLTPHLVSAFKNAQLIQQLVVENKNLHVALDMSRYGFLSVDMNLIVSCQSSTAMRLLHKYFPVSNNLPEEVVYFINIYRETILSGEFYLPLSLLEIEGENSKLKIRLTFESEAQVFVLLLEEERKPAPADLQILGLTGREAEILFFLMRGKTDREISDLCVISARTVQKHLENIFIKLGVQTRTAAVCRALETVR